MVQPHDEYSGSELEGIHEEEGKQREMVGS